MRQITEAIAGGQLKRGDKLPSHRDLAEQLVIAPLTVKKAYDELEAGGFIGTQRGRGTFVCATLPAPDPAGNREELKAAARNLLSQTYLAGLGLADAVAALEEAGKEMAEARLVREQEKS